MSHDAVRVLDEQWDYLIVLDACRYDYFERFYKEYLPEGNLSKKITSGTNTPEWLKKNYKKQTDVIYITGNPKITSTQKVDGFEAQKRFFRVHDVWHTAWNTKLHTVEPQFISEQAIEIVKANPGKRTIIHYMQPHEPYLTYHSEQFSSTAKQSKLSQLIYMCISQFLTCIRVYNRTYRWRIQKFLNLRPTSQMYWLIQEQGVEGLKRCYEENLQRALEAIRFLIEHLTGRIVVTSDHGEVLGENGLYGHWPYSRNRLLLEIPWLVIEKKTDKLPKEVRTEQEKPKSSKATKEEIEEKLRMLGY